MITSYIALYRPLLGAGSNWRFPGREGKPKSHDAIRGQSVGIIAKRCGLKFNPHAFRHLAAFMILKHNPAAYGLAQRVLGHKQLDTTVRFYTDLETAQALQHFQNEETKTHAGDPWLFPPALPPVLERYLDRFRPVFSARRCGPDQTAGRSRPTPSGNS